MLIYYLIIIAMGVVIIKLLKKVNELSSRLDSYTEEYQRKYDELFEGI